MSNSRDGQHRQTIHKGKVNYHPNRFDAPHTVSEAEGAFEHSPAPIHPAAKKVRALGPKFADHHSQAQLFYNSMTEPEKAHMVAAVQFELGKCLEEPVQQKIIDNLSNVSYDFALAVSEALSLTPAKPTIANHGKTSAFLSQVNGKQQVFTAAGRKVGMFVLEGFDVSAFQTAYAALKAAGVMPMIVGTRQKTKGSDGVEHKGEFTLETCRSTHFDAIMICESTSQTPKLLRPL